MACLANENFAFCDLKMPNFWTYFNLNVLVYDGGCTAPCVRKFYIDEVKVSNFRPFFSLNDFWVMQRSNPLPLTKKILHLVISKCLIYSGPFSALNL